MFLLCIIFDLTVHHCMMPIQKLTVVNSADEFLVQQINTTMLNVWVELPMARLLTNADFHTKRLPRDFALCIKLKALQRLNK